MVRGFEGFEIIEGWDRVTVGTVGRGWTAKGVGRKVIRVHEVMGIKRAGNEAIGIIEIRVLEWEKSGEGVKSLLREVNEGFEG